MLHPRDDRQLSAREHSSPEVRPTQDVEEQTIRAVRQATMLNCLGAHPGRLMEMESHNPQYFDWMDPTFGAHGPSFIHLQNEVWPMFENSLEQTLSITTPLPNRGFIEAKDGFDHGERNYPSGVFRGSIQNPGVETEQVTTAWSVQSSKSSQRRPTASLSHSESQQSSSSSNDQHMLDKVPGSPIEEIKISQRPAKDRGPVKRGRGRPRLFSPVVDVDNPADASAARESHLERNRISAEKCRQKKKNKYIARVTSEVSTLASRHSSLKEEVNTLREQVLNLKNEMLRHAGCGSRTIVKYIAQNADDQFAMGSHKTEASNASDDLAEGLVVRSVTESLPSQEDSESSAAINDYVSLWVLENDKSHSD